MDRLHLAEQWGRTRGTEVAASHQRVHCIDLGHQSAAGIREVALVEVRCDRIELAGEAGLQPTAQWQLLHQRVRRGNGLSRRLYGDRRRSRGLPAVGIDDGGHCGEIPCRGVGKLRSERCRSLIHRAIAIEVPLHGLDLARIRHHHHKGDWDADHGSSSQSWRGGEAENGGRCSTQTRSCDAARRLDLRF